MDPKTKADLDNHGVQLNPTSDAYWQSRGFEERPEDWEARIDEDDRKETDDPKSTKD